jgi:hypothetical protein
MPICCRPSVNISKLIKWDAGWLQKGNVELEVVFVAPDEDSDDENPEFEDETGFR